MRFAVSTAATVVLALATGAGSAYASAGGAAAPSQAAAPAPTTGAAVSPSGIATWFGPGFYGHETACGQTLTPQVVGVASRTLPCGTLVEVAYKGRTAVVPVLDRGPYGHIGAVWDLTAGAARALGITETVRIRTRVVGRAANTPALGLPAVPPAEALSGGAAAA